MAGINFGRKPPSQIKFEAEQKARRKAESAAFVAKAKARDAIKRDNQRRSAEAAAKKAEADKANREGRRTKLSSLAKIAGLTLAEENAALRSRNVPRVNFRRNLPGAQRKANQKAKRAAAAQRARDGPLTAGQRRFLAAIAFQAANPTTFRTGSKFGTVTKTVHNANFLRKKARVIAAGESVTAFQRTFARETKALDRAKGAASGESRKAGLETDDKGFLKPISTGTTFKRSIFDSVGISESGGVKKSTEFKLEKPVGQGRVGPSSAVLGGTVTKGKVGVLDFVGGVLPFVRIEDKTVIKQDPILSDFIGPIQPQGKQRNILEQGQDRLQAVSDSPLKFLLGTGGVINLGVAKTALSTFAFITNVHKQLGGLITGEQTSRLTEVSKEPTSEFLSGTIGAAFEGKGVVESLTAGGKSFVKESKRFGLLETVGNLGAIFIPGSQGLKGLSPLKLISFEGSKLLVATVPGKTTVLLSKGPGGKVVKGFDITSIGKEKFVALSTKFSVKAKGGAEIDFLGNVQSKILVSEKSLTSLTAAGFIEKGGADLIRAGKTVVKESKGLPKSVFRETFPEGSFGLNPKQLQAQTKFFKESKITLEGSSIDALANIPKFAIRPGDADIKVKTISAGQRLAAENLRRLSPLAEKGQRFFLGGKDKTQVILASGKSKGDKVAEFLVAGADETGQLAKKGKVLGVKTDTSTFKTAQGVKIRSGRFQTARMIASITSIQPSKIAGGPARIGPPINPLGTGTTRAKDFPKAFARTKTEASIAATELLKGKAAKLEGAAKIIKREGSKEISFPQFFKARGVKPEKSIVGKPTITGFKEPSLVSKFSSSKSPAKSLAQSPKSFLASRSLVTKSPRSPLASKPNIIRGSSIKTSISKAKITGSAASFIPPGSPSSSVITGPPGKPGLPGKPSPPGKPGFPSTPTKGGPASKIQSSSSSAVLLRQQQIRSLPLGTLGAIVKKSRPSPKRRRVDFLGSTLLSDIRSFRTKKEDIRFGRIGIARIVSKELRAAKSKTLIDDERGTKKITGEARFSFARSKAAKIKKERSSKLALIARI